jgi:type 1 fimbriae regulatory protein FimB/type 1 fimbriae regulatory protein FimE
MSVPVRLKNADYRSREYLTEQEVEQLMAAAGRVGRHGHRDATLILLAYRHGLRVTELVNLRWEQFDLNQGLLHINRLKRGAPSVHPLRGPELLAIRRLQHDYPVMPYVFSSERKAPLTPDAFRKIIGRAGKEAKLPFSIHPHMLRHACGYKLAQAGQDTRAIQHYLGHRNIQHTVRYTQLSAERFKDFWKD